MTTATAELTTYGVVNLIRRMSTCGSEAIEAQAATLIGPRTRGSTTEKGLDEVANVPLVEVTETLSHKVRRPRCRYFEAHVPDLGGRIGAVAYAKAMRSVYGIDPNAIVRRAGPHGHELVVDRPLQEIELPRTDTLYVILGPRNEYPGFPEGIVYTWHPGEPLRPLTGTENPSPHTAVKLYNENYYADRTATGLPAPPKVTINGVRIVNFSGGKPVKFDDGTVLAACDPERTSRLWVRTAEHQKENPGGWMDVELSYACGPDVEEELDRLDADPTVDVVIVAMPLLRTARAVRKGLKARTIRINQDTCHAYCDRFGM